MAEQHYVYIYRDLDGNPIYVGQGFGAARPADHLDQSHNPVFADWLRQNVGRYRLQIMGPLGSKTMADAVETALISACLPAARLNFMNVQPGRGNFMFRSYGVPEELAHRIAEPCGPEELAAIVRAWKSVMFVKVHQRDHPLRFSPADPPSDDVLRQRIKGSWQISRFRERWANDAAQSPRLLLGVTGVGGSQIIIASAQIAVEDWPSMQPKPGNLYDVPLRPAGSLDAAGLRGRPIRRDLGLKFDRARYGHFRIFDARGFIPAR